MCDADEIQNLTIAWIRVNACCTSELHVLYIHIRNILSYRSRASMHVYARHAARQIERERERERRRRKRSGEERKLQRRGQQNVWTYCDVDSILASRTGKSFCITVYHRSDINGKQRELYNYKCNRCARNRYLGNETTFIVLQMYEWNERIF